MRRRFAGVVTLRENMVVDFVFSMGEHRVMIGPTALSVRAGISKGYASDLLAGNKKPSTETALRIFRLTGLRLGIVAGLSDEQIAVLEEVHG